VAQIRINKNFINNIVKLALNEDLYPSGDITSSLIKNNKVIKLKLISKSKSNYWRIKVCRANIPIN